MCSGGDCTSTRSSTTGARRSWRNPAAMVIEFSVRSVLDVSNLQPTVGEASLRQHPFHLFPQRHPHAVELCIVPMVTGPGRRYGLSVHIPTSFGVYTRTISPRSPNVNCTG